MNNTTTILVTGCSGFIGSALCHKLCLSNYLVIGLDLNYPPSSLVAFYNFSFYSVDLAQPLPHFLPNQIDFVCHLAGQSSGEISFDSPVDDLNKNTVSTLNLIQYSLQSGCKRFFYASSMSVYGTQPDKPISELSETYPLSCYGVSKLASENYLRVYSTLPSTSFRMFNVYGPGQNMANLRQGMVSIYLAQAFSSSRIVVKGSGDRFRDFIYINDVVHIWLHSIRNYHNAPSILNIGTGVRTTVSDLLHQIQLVMPDVSISFTEGTPGDQNGIYSDNTLLSNFIGNYKTIPLNTGLKSFISSLTS